MSARRATSDPVVVLCGFMGTGKSGAGRHLANRLNVPFFDTDEMIEAGEKRSIADIFAKDGEARFRDLESTIIGELDTSRGAVIATGGGMVMDEGNFARLESMGTMVLLDAEREVIESRLTESAGRPLAGSGSGDLMELYEKRRPVYDRIPHRIDTSRRSAEETACDIAGNILPGGRVTHIRVDTLPLPGRVPTVENTRLSRVVVDRGASTELGAWLERLDLASASPEKPSVFLLIPPQLDELYGERITHPLRERSLTWQTVHVDDGDRNKTLAQADRLLGELAAAGAARDSVVVAVGGGVTGDIAGFVASVYMRGIPWFNIPTTLLAQVDASIGGKVGVNTAQAKNLIGSFHQPLIVLSDPELLGSLPPREISNGMAEVVKTSMIGDEALYKRLLDAARDGSRIDADLLGECVRACVRVKGSIVERDPHERGPRRVLNLGHTLGHALETSLAYTGLSHGEAVSLGLLAALRVAAAHGKASAQYCENTRELLNWCGLPVETPKVDEDAVRSALVLDKKHSRGELRFVMPLEPGRVSIERVSLGELMDAMRD